MASYKVGPEISLCGVARTSVTASYKVTRTDDYTTKSYIKFTFK